MRVLIGNVRGPQGVKGDTGATGAAGAAASVTVGTTTTAPYGTSASVTNSGSESAAVLDFVIPQGAPGEATTDMADLTLSAIQTTAANFPVPAAGESGKVIFGKIVKFFSDILAKANATNARTTPTQTTITAGSGVTVTTRYCWKFCDMVWIGLMFTLDSQVSTGTNLFTGMPGVPISGGQGLTSYFSAIKAADNSAVTCYVNSAGQLKCSGSMPAGTYCINGCYKCAT